MDIRVDKHISSCFITWNDDGEKNGTCAGGAATEAWSPSRFVNIFAANDKTKTSWESGGGCTTHVWVQKCPEGWCREHANNLNNLCHPNASMFRHSRAFRSHTLCESSVALLSANSPKCWNAAM